VAAVVLAVAVWVVGTANPAQAVDRFGQPWQGEIVAEHTVVYSQPSRKAPPVGPLDRGAIVVALGQDEEWTAIADGFIASGDLVEKRDPWVAEVAVASTSVYAKPDAHSPVRRTAYEGDLLRVTGVAPGVDGDLNVWWATTEGYVGLRDLRISTSEWARNWTLPSAEEAPKGWWGQVVSVANVRAGPTREAPVLGQFAGGERVKVLSQTEGERVGDEATWYRIDGGRYAGAYVHASLIRRIAPPRPNTARTPRELRPSLYIVVDRASTSLTLVREGKPSFVTYVALGLAGVDTPIGSYATFGKYWFDRMTSASVPDPQRSYNLPNVPFTQYYRVGGYAIHGTYWHDLFGTRQSQGCINVTWADGAYLFAQTAPEVAPEADYLWVEREKATPVLILN